jgi:hypothetical protein
VDRLGGGAGLDALVFAAGHRACRSTAWARRCVLPRTARRPGLQPPVESEMPLNTLVRRPRVLNGGDLVRLPGA